ncbi:MAG: endopeptidase IV [Legionellales bacterium RIFCSPHIGHO2_12_FULL_42_9]|nr:MAG: endopeptidase IV [Legionellales bacterium RIFCSPHIGHO2_12_FULL_42_9]
MKYLARSGVAWWILVLGCGLVVNISSAAESKDDDNHNPTGCRNVGYNFSLKVLHLYPGEVGARQSLYFIFNQLHEPINLYQLRDNEKLRNLYLNHSIAPQQWSVFATGEKELKFTCTINARGSNYGDIVDCADSIRVCEYNHVIFGLNNRGNYWLINSYTRNAAVNAVVHYGIIPAQ